MERGGAVGGHASKSCTQHIVRCHRRFVRVRDCVSAGCVLPLFRIFSLVLALSLSNALSRALSRTVSRSLVPSRALSRSLSRSLSSSLSHTRTFSRALPVLLYGVALVSRIDKMIGLFCKRDL